MQLASAIHLYPRQEKLQRYRYRDLLWLLARYYDTLLIIPPCHGTLWIYYCELQDFIVHSLIFLLFARYYGISCVRPQLIRGQRLSPHIYCSLVGITALIIDEDYATSLVNRRGVVNIHSGYCHLSNSGSKNEVRLKGRVRAGKW